MTSRSVVRLLVTFVILGLLTACGSNYVNDAPPRGESASIPRLPDDPIPYPEPKSRRGNGPVYEVFGKHYTVMNSASGYQERGVASWYGKKFHGNLTSMGETYDMYEMTAAHKTLPLPTFVRVRNLRNNRTVVVRVNDRGPFVHNRIIDLSYSAAVKLDMIGTGTSLVEVEAITFDGPSTIDEPMGDRPTRQVTPPLPESPVSAERISTQAFVQIGAFGSRENADRRIALLRSVGIGAGFVLADTSTNPALFRVRLGPIRSVEQYDMLIEELNRMADEYKFINIDATLSPEAIQEKLRGHVTALLANEAV